MLFPTIPFAIFFFIVFFVAWGLNKTTGYRKWFLVLASYFFYGYWDFRFVSLLIFSSFFNYFIGLLIQSSISKSKKIADSKLELDEKMASVLNKEAKFAKRCLFIGVAANLSILGIFKYFNFFSSNMTNLAIWLGLDSHPVLLEIILPVGISFFTFQGISYIVDVYRQDIQANKKIVDILLYISFFPQLVAGPIVRAAHFLKQLETPSDSSKIPLAFAIRLICFGLIKKVWIANTIGTVLVDPVFSDPAAFASIDIWAAYYGYAVQIYCDFSAYSDIAIGIAALLGFQFEKNFNHPYRATSLQDFWRRWHISLSSFLRDYLYIPLGGSKGGQLKTNRNLLLTMLLGGLWHGASWNFVLWGALHGGFLAVERVLKGLFQSKSKTPQTQLKENWLLSASKTLLIFHFVCIAWVPFRAATFQDTLTFFKGMLYWQSSPSPTVVTPFLVAIIVLSLASQYFSDKFAEDIEDFFGNLPIAGQALAMAGFLFGLSILAPLGTAPFIYFAF